MSDESSKFEPAESADSIDIYGEVVLTRSISGFFGRKKAKPARDAYERVIDAARRIN